MLSLSFKDDYYKLSFLSRLFVKVISTTAITLLIVCSIIFLLSDLINFKYAGALFALIAIQKLIYLRKAKKSLKRLPKHGKINVADYVSPKAKTIIISSLDKAFFREGNLSDELALQILEIKEIAEAVRRLGVNSAELISKIKGSTQNLKRKESKEIVEKRISMIFIRSFESAFKAGENSITPADILMAQIKDENDELCKIFTLFKITPEDLEKTLIFGRLSKEKKAIHTSFFAKRLPIIETRTINRAWTSRPTPILDMFSRDITNMARAGKSGFLIGHTKEYERLCDILSSPTKPNAILIGDPGVGKAMIVERLAYMIIKDQVSPELFDKRLVGLDVPALISGVNQAELQKRINTITNEIITAGNIILYIPEIHNLSKTSEEGALSVANALIPILKDDCFPVIGSTCYREYKKFIEQDNSFVSVFEPVWIKEISESEAEEYLSYSAVILEKEWKIEISFMAIKKAVIIAKKYFRDKPLPSSAEWILKESLAEARMAGNTILNESDVIRVAEKRVNIPIHRIGLAEKEALLNLEEKIHERVINQEEAVFAVARSLREYRSELSRQGGPIASFLFVGPTGVGKTELAKALAKIQFGSEDMMIRFDMSEFQGKDSITRLLGDKDGKIYGAFTESVSEKPYSLVLLDKLEKANSDVLNLFLQVLNDGRLTDGAGRTVDFQNTIIIATSNAHSSFIKELFEQGESSQTIGELLKKQLTEYFKQELLNRFSNIITFKTLSVSDMEKITVLQLKSLAKMLNENQGIAMEFDDNAISLIVREGYDPAFGARPLCGVISKLIKDPLSSKMLKEEIQRGDYIKVSAQNEEIVFIKSEPPYITDEN